MKYLIITDKEDNFIRNLAYTINLLDNDLSTGEIFQYIAYSSPLWSKVDSLIEHYPDTQIIAISSNLDYNLKALSKVYCSILMCKENNDNVNFCSNSIEDIALYIVINFAYSTLGQDTQKQKFLDLNEKIKQFFVCNERVYNAIIHTKTLKNINISLLHKAISESSQSAKIHVKF